MKLKIFDYEIVVQGVEWPDYYHGFGVSFSHYDLAYTGIGASEYEAAADAIDQIAMAGFEIPEEMEREAGLLSHKDEVSTHYDPDGASEGPYMHVGIRICTKDEA